MKNSKKRIFTVSIIISVFCIGMYLKPMSLSDIANDSSTLLFSKVNAGWKDGRPYTESEVYNEITDEQKQKIIQLLNKYSYSRDLKTLFSDGSMLNNGGDGCFHIAIFNGLDYLEIVTVGYNDEISLNDKIYKMKNSDVFIEEILTIIDE